MTAPDESRSAASETGSPDPRLRKPRRTVTAPAILLVWAVLGVVLHRLAPWSMPGSVALDVTSKAMAGFALALWAWAALECRRQGTSLDPSRPATSLVTTGPFRYSRNPAYLAIGLLLIGISISGKAVWPLMLTLPVFFALHRITVPHEESELEATFGAAYLHYKSTVPRWLGRRGVDR